MISVEAWTTIRYIKAQGLGKRTIANELGVARNTVKPHGQLAVHSVDEFID